MYLELMLLRYFNSILMDYFEKEKIMKKFQIFILVLIFAVSIVFIAEPVRAGNVVSAESVQAEPLQAEKSKLSRRFNPDKFIGTRTNSVVLQGTSTIIIANDSGESTAGGPLVDGVSCKGRSPENYICSSDKVRYGCSPECNCCFYEEKE